MLGIFEALIPGISQNRIFLITPSEETTTLKGSEQIWQTLFALNQQKGVGLVMLLRFSGNVISRDNASLLPYIIRMLKSLGFNTAAQDLALSHMMKLHD